MGFGVGVTFMKLANHVSSKASRRRTGNLRSVACEALSERWSRDPDIDKRLTPLNEYQGISSGLELTELMTQAAEEYSKQRRAAGRRGLRSDASLMFATIIKPEEGTANSWTTEDRRRFFEDSSRVLDDILNTTPAAAVTHVDEGAPHMHRFYPGWTEDGELCVDKIVNPRLWQRINTEFPEAMRALGWDVADCELYDEQRAASDPEYAEARRERRKQYGRGSAKYKADKEREQAQKDAEAIRSAAEAQAGEIIAEAEEERQKGVEAHQEGDKDRAAAGAILSAAKAARAAAVSDDYRAFMRERVPGYAELEAEFVEQGYKQLRTGPTDKQPKRTRGKIQKPAHQSEAAAQAPAPKPRPVTSHTITEERAARLSREALALVMAQQAEDTQEDRER